MVFRFNAALSATGYADKPAASGEIGRFICYTACATPYPLSLMLRSPQGLCRKASRAGPASRSPVLTGLQFVTPRSPHEAMPEGQPHRASEAGPFGISPLSTFLLGCRNGLGQAASRIGPKLCFFSALTSTGYAERPATLRDGSALCATSNPKVRLSQRRSA